MKKNKKFMEVTPVIETREATCVPGSVGEFIEILKDFPADAKFTLNGSVDINGKTDIGDEFNTNIYKLPDGDCEPVKEPFFKYPEDDYVTDECECCNNEGNSLVMDDHLFGIGYKNNGFINGIRRTSSDNLVEPSVMMPNDNELKYEGTQLAFNQVKIIDEIRQHNMYVAECMAEMHRREIAALLEYNTQCLAHFGAETNKVMCVITDVYGDTDEDN